GAGLRDRRGLLGHPRLLVQRPPVPAAERLPAARRGTAPPGPAPGAGHRGLVGRPDGDLPAVQQWLGVDRDLRKPWVLTDYARTTGHLAEGTPGPGSTGVHEKGFLPRPPDVARPGHIPVLGFADTTLEQHAEEVAEICRWAAEHGPAAELDQP